MSAGDAARQEPRWADTSRDGWAILAQPPGRRDLSCPELWERSLARSQRRREAAASRRRIGQRGTVAKVSAALLVATVAAPAGQMATAQATTTAGSSLLRMGSRGAAVAAVQRALGIGADGVFGPQTRRAVKRFQRAHGLAVDGVVGPATAGALGVSLAGTSTRRAAHHGRGGAVRGPRPSHAVTVAIQRKLGLSADGVYGPLTRRAVRSFQASHGLTVDGVVGPQTLAALGLSGSSSSSSAPARSGAMGAVAAAQSKLGAPYVSSGTGPSGFDCSGLTQWAFRQAGISLPRTSYAQYGVGSVVSRSAVQAGDLVFFNTSGGGASHVGIAISNASAISATTHGVMVHSISGSYWGSHYVGARRV